MRYSHHGHPFLYRVLCRMLCLTLLLGMLSPGAFAGGKKHFKEGLKCEITEEWDRAAEEFSLALREEPGNAEYKLHFLKSLQKASLMFMNRARILAEQKDYEGAYLAYKQAFNFDPTNEQAQVRMREMLLKQGIPSTSKGEPDPYQKTSEKTKEAMEATRAKRVLKSYDIPNDTVENIIRLIAKQDLHFNVIFDQQSKSFISNKIKFEMYNVSAPQALEALLDANNLTFFRSKATRTILIGQRNNPQLAQKYDESMVKTFYIRNAKLQDAQNVVTQMLGAGKQVAQNTQNNSITVRDSAENLKIIQSLIASIDKPQAEVVMDVNIYEVSQDDTLQIGNQILAAAGDPSKPQPSLADLGGIGRQAFRGATAAGGLFGPLGLSLAIPQSTLSFLQSKGNTKLVAQTQLHSFESEEASVNIGRQVPIQTASIPTLTTSTGTTGTGTTQPAQSLYGGINQVQYKDVGLNISIKPKVIDDLVQMNLSIEASDVVASATATLTPTFTQRKVKGVARVRDGQTTIAASVMQQNDSVSRTGIPILSLIPGLGHLFSTPNRDKRATNIIITVTPHILRGGAVTEEDEQKSFGPLDFIIGPTGAQSYGRQLSLEELVEQADRDEQQEANNQADATVPASQRNSTFMPTKANGTGYGAVPGNHGDGLVRTPAPAPPTDQGSGASTKFNSPTGNVPAGTPIPVQQIPVNNVTSPNGSSSPGSGSSSTGSGGAPNGTGNGNNQPPQPPVPMAVVISPTIRPQVGQIITVAVIVSQYGAKISAASFYLHYNSAVLKVVGIRDGGLLQPGNFNSRDDGGQVFAGVTLNQGTGAVAAAGQIAQVDFQVVAAGAGDLRMDVVDLRGPDQQMVPVSLNSIPGVAGVGSPQQPQE